MLTKFNEIRARRARGEDTGFSLIELLVVVVIMGILIAIAIPVYLNYQEGAKKKSVESDVRNAIPAVEQCISDNAGEWEDGVCDDEDALEIKMTGDNSIDITAPAAGSSAYQICGETDAVDGSWHASYDSGDTDTSVVGEAGGC